ncbi:MAG: deoxyribose-phosphate aldolase [Oscillospiraceae bacterium]
MEIKSILSIVDHTLLLQTATWEEIKVICDDGMKYQTASVCIAPYFVKKASLYCGEKLKICTVIGFPNGYNTTAVKVFETKDAIQNGASEIDMVANLGLIRAGLWNEVIEDIKEVKKACGDKILKVIIETCLLTDAEKAQMCKCVTEAGADFIKTSTGFSTGGATVKDIQLFASHVGAGVKIKAAGGIKSLDDAMNFMENGASRLGTSSVVKIVKGGEISGY